MFIYFGTNTFNRLNDVQVQKNISVSDGICFSHLSTSDQPTINDVYIGWSYLLFKTDDKIYHAGFWRYKSKQLHLRHIAAFDDDEVNNITCGFKHSLTLTKSGYCFSFTDENFKLKSIDFGENNGKIKGIITDDLNTLSLTTDGNVYVLNNEGTLSPCLLPMPVPVKEVVCGKEHILLLSNCGRLFSFGVGSRGQLGHGAIEILNKPVVIEALDGIKIKSISCGGWHSAAISTEGDLYMWGWNESGQLGLPCSELHGDELPIEEIETVCCLPRLIDLEGESPRLVECGSRHTAVLTENNHLWTWGWNGYGQLGHKRTLLSDTPERVDLPPHFLPSSLKCKFWSTLIVGSLKES